MSELIPAATVVLARDRAGELEVLMLRRDAALAFSGGSWVFPGGRVDTDDWGTRPDDRAAAEARAAVREAHEEAGLRVAATSLVRWSHWTPPDHGQSHRFSTAFFVAAAPEGEVTIDDGEIRDHRWTSPAAALAAQAAGEIELRPPTYITLVQLAVAPTTDELLARAAAATPEHFHTRIADHRGVLVALYHGDAGYHDGDAARPGPRHRLEMGPGAWNYRRDAVS